MGIGQVGVVSKVWGEWRPSTGVDTTVINPALFLALPGKVENLGGPG